MKYSKLLTSLFEQALEEGEAHEGAVLTAERLLFVMLKRVSGRVRPNEDDELTVLRQMMADVFPDSDPARKMLAEAAIRSGEALESAVNYMNYILDKTRNYGYTQEIEEITAVMLLTQIVHEPTETVSYIMRKTGFDNPCAVYDPRRNDGSGADPTEKMKADIIAAMGKKLGGVSEPLPADVPRFGLPVSDDDGIDTAEDILGAGTEPRRVDNPIDELTDVVAHVKNIRSTLSSTIFGQDNAINVFATGYFRSFMLSLTESAGDKPRATFLFAGPPGVGKTFMAQTAADALGLPFMRFDMSEYADKEANLEFCGSDKVYKNGKAGNVTSFVEENPRCVLLFDEIEKAHVVVIHLFLQMLDAGRLRDNFTDKEVSFKDAIIILTTNAGKQLYEQDDCADLSGLSRKVIIDALRKDVNPETKTPYFPSAICSRFASGNVVMFNHIRTYDLLNIARREMRRHANNLADKLAIGVDIDENVYTALLMANGAKADARTVRSRAESFFNDEMYELMRLLSSDKVKSEIRDLSRISIEADLSGAEEKVKKLFADDSPLTALIVADDDIVQSCREGAPGVEYRVLQNKLDAVLEVGKRNYDFVMLDMTYGISESDRAGLNLEDADTLSRAVLKHLRENGVDAPVYLVQNDGPVSEEEMVSFTRQGVRGALYPDTDGFVDEMEEVVLALHHQASMDKLARESKAVTFETAQSVSDDGEDATIRLFDFRLITAVESEDMENILGRASRPNVRFDQVIGAEDAKQELQYFVDYLRDPEKYAGTGVKAPKGVLLYGPPGTGKTLLAKAMACEAGVTFIATDGNQFLKRYVGEGSAEVHKLFKTARKYAPAILFIDEIDAIAKERKGSDDGDEQTLTAFLTEMDGFVSDPSRPVFVLAATNFDVEPGGAKSLDGALLRRFDRRVLIDLPDKAGRLKYLKMKCAANPALAISPDTVNSIALRSIGMSLAELDSAVELALRSAIRAGSTTVTDDIFEEAFETFNGGEVKKWDVSTLERVARHEAGHAIVSYLCGRTPSYVTVVAREGRGGYMMHAVDENKPISTMDELLVRIRIALGGRAAEIVYYGERDGVSTGASGDLRSATAVARNMICYYGMDGEFGLAAIGNMDAAMSEKVMAAVNRILSVQMAEAIRQLSENKDKVDALVAALMENDHLNGDEIERLLSVSEK
ncbi:MAG: AAA family ATPase [Clostridia bacterium]|nr:AAA family ATPase [Clostridia bacterium]